MLSTVVDMAECLAVAEQRLGLLQETYASIRAALEAIQGEQEACAILELAARRLEETGCATPTDLN